MHVSVVEILYFSEPYVISRVMETNEVELKDIDDDASSDAALDTADPLPVEFEQKHKSMWDEFLEGISLRGRMIHVLLGTAFFHFTLPVILPWIQANGRVRQSAGGPAGNVFNIEELTALFIKVGVGSAIGSMVMAMLVMKLIRGFPRDTPFKEFPHVLGGAIFGAPLALLNIPGYMAMAYLPMDRFWLPRYILLFAYTGVVCGAWTGWQAYKEHHPDRGMLPELSIWSFIETVLAIAFIGVIFLPWEQLYPGMLKMLRG